MKKKLLLAALIVAGINAFPQDLPKVVAGKICRHEKFSSNYVTARNVDVWLPESYSPDKKYPVLYMHDGQMLFDSARTWNHLAWNVDAVLSELMKEHKIRDVIVVAIWNGDKTRHSDYFPQKPFESMSKEQKEAVYAAARTNGVSVFNDYQINSDSYLKFIVSELKPFIDRTYSSLKDRENTFIAGSSMGGLISLYAICEFPEVFGGAACMSTHWPGIFAMENNPIPDAFINYLRKKLPDPKTHKIYFDYGDQTLDAMYPSLQKKVDQLMKKKGYSGKNWETLFFPGKDHSEISWSQRFHIPMEFLLGK